MCSVRDHTEYMTTLHRENVEFLTLQQVVQVLSGLTFHHCNSTKIKFLALLTQM